MKLNKSFAYCDKFIPLLTPFESMWDSYIGSNKALQHEIELKKTGSQPINSSKYWSKPMEKELENQ